MTRKMRDSGIEWIGQIPEDWEVTRIAGLYSLRNTKVNDLDYPPLSVTKNGIVPQLESAAKTNDHNNRKLVKKDDFVINSRSDRRGSCGISKLDGSVSLINTVLSPLDRMDPEYYNWLFTTPSFADEFYKWGNGIVDDLWTTGWNKMKDINVPSPSLDEQKKISKYLNSRTLKINKLMNKISNQIQTLEDYKKSIITEAVTKGLDKNVEMKDSGIEWIGEIPKHWNVTYLKSFFDEGKNKNKLGRETNLLSLSYGEIIKKDINTQTGLLPQNFNNYNIVEEGSIIIRPTDLQNDKKSLRTGLVKERGIITSAYINLKPKKNVASKYFHYLLHSYDLMKVFYNMGSGVRQGLTYSEFSKLLVLSPNNLEQEQIIFYLDRKTKVIDDAIATKQKQLETLEEYKKSLIYEYVTGKKEVE